MSEAFVYDAIRTPRGKGKKDGSLHEVKPVDLLAGLLGELQRRNDFDTGQVDDVVMGVVSPIGEQGSVIAKVAALKAGWDYRCAGMQLNAEPRVSWQALVMLQQLWKEALEPARALRQSAGKSPARNAYEQETNQSSSDSVRSPSQAATVAGSATAAPGSVTAAAGATVKQPRRSQLRPRQERRSR